MLAEQQFAEFYSDHSISVLLEDIMEYPILRGQVTPLQKKHGSREGDDVGADSSVTTLNSHHHGLCLLCK